MLIVYISILIIFVLLLLIHRRLNKTKEDVKSLSIVELKEFDGLNAEVKEMYRVLILESWMQAFNAAINNEFDRSGISQFYKDNKEKVLRLNDLYLQIAKLSMNSSTGSFGDDFKLLMYNANLERLIKDAEAKVVELEALNNPTTTIPR